MSTTHSLLAKYTVTSTAAPISFTSLPTYGYSDLLIKISNRTSYVGTAADFYMYFNNDAGTTKCNGIRLNQNGTSIGSSSYSNSNTITVGSVGGTTSTANGFSQTDIFISNFLSTYSNKTIVATSNFADNTTGAGQGYFFGNYASTNPISRIDFTVATGFAPGTEFSIYGLTNSGITQLVNMPKAYGGDIVHNDGTYWYHIFTNSGTFGPKISSLPCEIMVVGGGAGGGNFAGGGGGAGAIHLWKPQTLSGTSYSVTVGAGGAGGPQYGAGYSGGNSSFAGTTTLTADGGGGGGAQNAEAASGGCGGGSTGGTNNYAQASTLSFGKLPTGNGFGNKGGNSFYGRAGGGGGYSQPGINSTNHLTGVGTAILGQYMATYIGRAGDGGQGYTLPATLQSLLSMTVIASGGGGGCVNATAGTTGTGGTGAGSGGYDGGQVGTSATSYGSGGGGSGGNSGSWNSLSAGSGFQGLVVVRYPV